jgi:hypothetical protein
MKCLFVLFLFSFNAFSAEVLFIKGKVLFEGKPLQLKQSFADTGKITTSADSAIKISSSGHTIVLGPNSEFLLKPLKDESSNLIKGSLRWISGKYRPERPVFSTANATFGVRGTDFVVTFNDLLGESEIVCFSGEVDFKSGEINKSVKKNQWGGVGGRFGNDIGKILDLPSNVMTHFNQAYPIL